MPAPQAILPTPVDVQAVPPPTPLPPAAASPRAAGEPAGSLGSFKRGEPVTLNFVNAEIEAVARAVGVMTGRNMVIDPRVKGTLNMTTERPVSVQAACTIMTTELE